MINTSDAFKAAITGTARRVRVKASVDLVDPDLVYGTATQSDESLVSEPEEIFDKEFSITASPYATLEHSRWVLDGERVLIPASGVLSGQVGAVGEEISGNDGGFASPPWVELSFSGVTTLQAFSVYFSQESFDGWAEDYTVEVLQGGSPYYTETVTGARERYHEFSGFTVYNPDAIRVTVTKWALPHRRLRLAELLVGIYEEWGDGDLAAFNVTQQANFSVLALPYGTCSLRMDNADRRFEPRNKNGLFQSIEERQAISVSIGVDLPNGNTEYCPVGTFYQFSGGWKTSDNGLTIQWDLVDIVGLIADREYIVPATLPTTLGGWVASIVAQLGKNFEQRYMVDSAFAGLSLTTTADKVTGQTCGAILLSACMATGTWPRADAQTGFLAVSPLWSEGNKLTLDNMNTYPVLQANSDIAALVFDIGGEQFVVSGTATASSDTVSVSNPFVTTQTQALAAAKNILAAYGGNQIVVTGRGDPSSELGDVDTVWLDESGAVTGRRMSQTFDFSSGVMMNCQSVLLQADGSYLFENRAVLTESGSFTVPDGVSSLRVVLIGGGSGGTAGTSGSLDVWTGSGIKGEVGTPGAGGKVWTGTINVSGGQVLNAALGAGGGEGQDGTPTTFGNYSSANGQRYPYGFTDVASGDAFGRTGVPSPAPGSGDGGAGGKAGAPGYGYYETLKNSQGIEYQHLVVVSAGGPGGAGVAGASGAVVIYWDKEVTE